MTSTVPSPPKTGGSRAFIAVAAIMLLVGGGLIWWKSQGSDEPKPTASAPAPKPTETPAAVLDQPPPPPPPPEEEEPEDAAAPAAKVTKPSAGSGGGGCSGPCEGTAPAQLRSTLFGKGGQARSCYERALRQNPALKGRMSVAVRIGPRGQVCSVGISQDSLGDPGIASCVKQIFRAGSYPAPQGGCVDTVVPLNFVPRQ